MMRATVFPRRRFRARAAMIGLILGILSFAATASAQITTQDIVDQTDVASYQHYLADLLYTHPGHNRGYGAEHDLARANIVGELQAFGLDVSLEPFTWSSTTYYNVVAVKPGAVNPKQQYIIGAHFDSVGNPGADDNGSGTAGVMEIARVLSQYDFESTLVFIAFDREEQGLIGSDAYATQHAADAILGMISMDMIAYNSGANSVDIYGRSASNPLKAALGWAVAKYSSGLTYATYGAFDASDHAPFEWQGFQACLIIEDWGNPYYHTPNDHVEMPDYIDYDFALKVVRSVCGLLVDQAGLIQPPCPADLNGDGNVNSTDLTVLLGAWAAGTSGGDIDGDGDTDSADLTLLLGVWAAGGCV